MRILIIHQYYKRGDTAGGSRWNEMARVWREAGHDVTVLAGMYDFRTAANYPEYRGKLIAVERTEDDIEVRRVYTPASYDKNYLWRALAYFSFLFLGAIACVFTRKRFDVVVASSPPLTVGPLGVVISICKSVPLVFEIRDLWPESAIDTGVLTNPYLIKLLYMAESLSYRFSKRINALTPAFRQALRDRKGIPAGHIWMIPNAADLEIVTPGPRDNAVRARHNWQDRFVALYTGAHGRANHLWQLIDAAEKLKDDPDFLIACLGNGMERDKLIAEAERRGLANIQFLPAVPKSQVKDYLNAADVSVIVLKRIDTFKTVYPNKMFDSMSAATPIVLAIDGVARELVVDQARCGTYVEPENADQIVQALRTYRAEPALLKEHGENGLRFVREHYDRRELARTYLDLIEQEVAGRGRSPGRRPVRPGDVSQKRCQLAVKRCFDVVAALLGLIVLGPMMLLIALVVRLTSKGPALFAQDRLGKDERVFRIYKFRTMTVGAAHTGPGVSTLPEDPRLTRLGRILRKASLDELPQLINVLRGQMSLVGPRPTVPAQLEYYGPFERRRLEMLPGVTGLAMVRGRSSNPWSVRIKYDVEYIETFSLWLDLKIIMKTLWLVVRRKSTAYDYAAHGKAFDLVKPGESEQQRTDRLDV